jgi:hypothetical protein
MPTTSRGYHYPAATDTPVDVPAVLALLAGDIDADATAFTPTNWAVATFQNAAAVTPVATGLTTVASSSLTLGTGLALMKVSLLVNYNTNVANAVEAIWTATWGAATFVGSGNRWSRGSASGTTSIVWNIDMWLVSPASGTNTLTIQSQTNAGPAQVPAGGCRVLVELMK